MTGGTAAGRGRSIPDSLARLPHRFLTSATQTDGVAEDEPRNRVAHLLRRATFGARPEELDAAVAAGYDATVERLVDLARADTGAGSVQAPTLTPPPAASDLPSDPEARRRAEQATRRTQREETQKMVGWWLDRMVASTNPLRERLTHFWHDHFATSIEKVRQPELMYGQNQLFRAMGWGSFETLAVGVARDPAMLLWLDSNSNRKGSPNENFARELFELFTLGIGNYTEADIAEAARAFTGWQVVRATGAFRVAPSLHDEGTKTVLGQTANLGGDDVVRLACRQPACARFVVAKVWSHFTRPVGPDDPVVRDLAPGFARDLDVARLMRAVFLHPEFSAPASRTGLVKTPVEWAAGALRALGLVPSGNGAPVVKGLASLGQVPFQPPSVGGWPANRYWLSSAFALARLSLAVAALDRAKPASVTTAPVNDRPAAAARLLGVDGWGATTQAALSEVASEPSSMLALALVSPEYVMA